jgi:hypothetical protein
VHATGGSCTATADCAGGTCIGQNGAIFSGGYCTQTCSGTSGCAAGSACSSYLLSGQSLCMQTCTWNGGQSTCRAGYVCDRYLLNSLGDAAACLSACTSAADCGGGGFQCQSGFCCGASQFRCCSGNTCPVSGTCQANGYCG